ncbi:peptidase inhibitor family I36 protein [Streptomyces erythrochromogenes]|uniref:peptidase inhibitor family I36 protein n=1 Tax=Streptomyces erythrochromogenes TaxID=285574 RepID=UPI00386A71A4|nr:peptidase inhibitor family I36 protein [Streptomyces erythrochromogenes]
MTTRPQAVTTVTAGAARRRARAVSVLGVLCLLLALAPAARADSGGRAAPAPSPPCAPGWLCGWTGPAYTGVASLAKQDMPRFPETTAYVGFNDAASVWNAGRTWSADGVRQGRCVTVYNKPDYTGSRLTVRPGQGIPQLAASFGHVRSSRFHTCRLS